MIILSCEPNPTTLDDLLQIPNKEFHNKEHASLKQCFIDSNNKVADLINLSLVNPSPDVPNNDKPIRNESSSYKYSHPL